VSPNTCNAVPASYHATAMAPSPTPLPEGDEKVRAVRTMFDTIAPRYDLVNRVMTFRMDVGWRRRTVERLGLPAGSRVLDVACGTGDLCEGLLDAGVRPVGCDLAYGMLAAAHTRAPLVQADALALPLPDRAVDGVTCGFALRNLVALEPFLAEVARVVRPGGRIGLLEVATPANPVMRWGHRLYFGRVVPLIGGLLSDRAAYLYLPRSVAYLPDPPRLLEMVTEAGFTEAESRSLSGGIAQVITATRRR
jgi:demethylmenaquinone methyltransferase / 2-methoxy-6-polyprenyl-1,4-benzoquinol methylase